MTDSEQITVPDKNSLRTIAVDLLLCVFMGSTISLLIMLAFYRSKGAADLMEIFLMSVVIVFVNTPYSPLFRFVMLVPIYVPIFSILINRSLVLKVTSRKDWLLPALVVAATSSAAAVAVTMLGLLFIKYGGAATYAGLFSLGLLFILPGFLIGASLGLIFAPARRILKILIAVMTSAIVGGFFEIAFLRYIVQ